MIESESYHQYAEECRKLAATVKNLKHKKELEEMADAWTVLCQRKREEGGCEKSS